MPVKFVAVLITAVTPLLMGLPAKGEGPQCKVPEAVTGGRRGPSSVAAKGSPEIKVIQLDPDVPLEELKLEGYDVVPFDEFVELDPWMAPDPHLREEIFSAAEMSSYLRGWDQLSRDMLFLRAQEQSPAVLKRKYPAIPEKTLKKLVRVIAIEKGKRGRK